MQHCRKVSNPHLKGRNRAQFMRFQYTKGLTLYAKLLLLNFRFKSHSVKKRNKLAILARYSKDLFDESIKQ